MRVTYDINNNLVIVNSDTRRTQYYEIKSYENNDIVLEYMCETVFDNVTNVIPLKTDDMLRISDDVFSASKQRCKYCRDGYMTVQDIASLRIYKTSAYLCPICGKKHDLISDARTCCLRSKTYYACDHCGAVVFDRGSAVYNYVAFDRERYRRNEGFKIVKKQYEHLFCVDHINVVQCDNGIACKSVKNDYSAEIVKIAYQYKLLAGQENYDEHLFFTDDDGELCVRLVQLKGLITATLSGVNK